jgi:CO/xanthine dehydrogenase Mo-binding subunit
MMEKNMTVGQSQIRLDVKAKVTGEALFSGDINLPNQAYAKILFSKYPHAIIHALDVSEALKMDGVLTILTAADVPVNEYGLQVPDQPVLCGPGSQKPFADHVRFIGDQVAFVIADTEEIAAQAIKRIRVDYEELPVITDPREAMKSEAMLLHPDTDSNVFTHYRIRKGDTKEAFAKCDVIVESTYHTPPQEHAYLQPEAGISYFDEEGRIAVAVGGQWVHEEQEQIAHALGVPPERIRVIHPAIGGAFGGREDMSIQIVLALGIVKLQELGKYRPVKIIWSREESIIGHHKRHPYYMKARWGATREGKVIAADNELIADGGAYWYTSNKVLGNATVMCTGPYEIPNVKVDTYAVYTNNLPNGAFRGFGGPQGAFLAEMQINKLAEALNMDPVELRMRNLLEDDSITSVGTPLPAGVTIKEVVEDCASSAYWEHGDKGWHRKPLNADQEPDKPYLKRGIGFACAFKNAGFSFGALESSNATIELHGEAEIDYAVLHYAGADVGQGSHTAFAQMAAQALGLPMDKIRMVVADTAQTENSGSASASRSTLMAGNAILGAADAALRKWKEEERPAIASFRYRAPRTTQFDPETGYSMPNFSYGYVAESVEVEVDIETGGIRILNVVCSDDVGKAINPQQVEGQMEGAIVQATGYVITENLIEDAGQVVTKYFSTYLIPTVLDIPEHVEKRILEFPDPIGPWGARGMGEMPFLPFAPAIMDAVHDATGVWINEFTLTPERVVRNLEKRALKK